MISLTVRLGCLCVFEFEIVPRFGIRNVVRFGQSIQSIDPRIAALESFL